MCNRMREIISDQIKIKTASRGPGALPTELSGGGYQTEYNLYKMTG